MIIFWVEWTLEEVHGVLRTLLYNCILQSTGQMAFLSFPDFQNDLKENFSSENPDHPHLEGADTAM